MRVGSVLAGGGDEIQADIHPGGSMDWCGAYAEWKDQGEYGYCENEAFSRLRRDDAAFNTNHATHITIF